MIIPKNCCQNFSSGYFDPFDLQLEQIDIVDIAHALSNICRFSGRTKQFYSVAQHCVLGAKYIERFYGWDIRDKQELMLTFLLHDANEAYLLDLPSPLKERMEFDFFKKLEDKINHKIEKKFNLTVPIADNNIKNTDILMLYAEKRDLMEYAIWNTNSKAPPTIPTILPISPTECKMQFLELFEDLWKKLRQ